MESILKQCFGIDISKLDFTVCLATKTLSGKTLFGSPEKFSNSKKGFNQFVRWSRKVGDPTVRPLFLMEATGIYYEPLAYHLNKLKQDVSVILPNKVKHFAKSLNIKSKTDSIDARVIGRLGTERVLPHWKPPRTTLKTLRDLTRLYSDLKKEKTVYLNRCESNEAAEKVTAFIRTTNKKILREIEKQIVKCEEKITETISSDPWLKKKVEKLLSIKGVGLITIAIIVAETQGFEMIRNRKQLASYAGFDIVQKESGTSVKGKTRISKKGNSRIRAALYFPALVASRHNKDLRQDYQRIIQNKPSKKVGVTALQRKILLLMYTLWKKDEVYREEKEDNSGNHETKLLLCPLNPTQNKVGNPYELPTQDELPYKQSTEVLLCRY